MHHVVVMTISFFPIFQNIYANEDIFSIRLLSSTLSRFVPGNNSNYTNSFTLSSVFNSSHELPETMEPVFGAKLELNRSNIILQGMEHGSLKSSKALNLHDYTRGITPKRVRSGEAQLRVLAPGKHSFEFRNRGEPLATLCRI